MTEVAVSLLLVVLLIAMVWIRHAMGRMGKNDENINGLKTVLDKMNERKSETHYKTGSNEKVTSTMFAKLKILNHDPDS